MRSCSGQLSYVLMCTSPFTELVDADQGSSLGRCARPATSPTFSGSSISATPSSTFVRPGGSSRVSLRRPLTPRCYTRLVVRSGHRLLARAHPNCVGRSDGLIQGASFVTMADSCLSTGSLTPCLQSNIVSNVALSALCVDISLHKVLSQEGPTVWPAVERYARDVTKAKAEELKAAAEEKRPHKVYWAHLDAPKVRLLSSESTNSPLTLCHSDLGGRRPDRGCHRRTHGRRWLLGRRAAPALLRRRF